MVKILPHLFNDILQSNVVRMKSTSYLKIFDRDLLETNNGKCPWVGVEKNKNWTRIPAF